MRISQSLVISTAPMPTQNGRHFADDIFKCIFMNENVWILMKISLKFVPKVPINNIPALVQIMAWRRPGDKPLSEPIIWLVYRRIYASPGLNELMYVQFLLSVHYSDIIMSVMESQIIGVSIVCSTVCSGADQRKHQSCAALLTKGQ